MRIKAYDLCLPGENFYIGLRVPAAKREWLPEYAYRCTPLTIANRSGIELFLKTDVNLRWNGGEAMEDLEVRPKMDVVASHFGSGIVSFVIPFLFRTPLGWSMWVLGPANDPMDGCAPLEGVVETAWSPMTFTMNWRMTMRDEWVHFFAGQAIGRIVPVRMAMMENLQLQMHEKDDLPPKKKREYDQWAESRDEFLRRLKAREPQAEDQGWQKAYMKRAVHKRLKPAVIE